MEEVYSLSMFGWGPREKYPKCDNFKKQTIWSIREINN